MSDLHIFPPHAELFRFGSIDSYKKQPIGPEPRGCGELVSMLEVSAYITPHSGVFRFQTVKKTPGAPTPEYSRIEIENNYSGRERERAGWLRNKKCAVSCYFGEKQWRLTIALSVYYAPRRLCSHPIRPWGSDGLSDRLASFPA